MHWCFKTPKSWSLSCVTKRENKDSYPLNIKRPCYEVPKDNVQRQFFYFIVAICRNTLKSFVSQFL